MPYPLGFGGRARRGRQQEWPSVRGWPSESKALGMCCWGHALGLRKAGLVRMAHGTKAGPRKLGKGPGDRRRASVCRKRGGHATWHQRGSQALGGPPGGDIAPQVGNGKASQAAGAAGHEVGRLFGRERRQGRGRSARAPGGERNGV